MSFGSGDQKLHVVGRGKRHPLYLREEGFNTQYHKEELPQLHIPLETVTLNLHVVQWKLDDDHQLVHYHCKNQHKHVH